MTKLINVKICVPTDDQVTTEDLQRVLRALLEGQPAESQNGGRIHWSAVDVSRVVERPPSRRPARKALQGEMAT